MDVTVKWSRVQRGVAITSSSVYSSWMMLREDTSPYLVSICILAYVMQLPRKEIADLSSLLNKY